MDSRWNLDSMSWKESLVCWARQPTLTEPLSRRGGRYSQMPFADATVTENKISAVGVDTRPGEEHLPDIVPVINLSSISIKSTELIRS